METPLLGHEDLPQLKKAKAVFVGFADAHCDELARGYTDTSSPSGLPCYLDDAARSFKWLIKFVDELRDACPAPVHVLFGGDMFHHKSYVSSSAAGVAGVAWKAMGDRKIGISGNHDEDGRSSLLAGWAHFHTNFLTVDYPDFSIVLAPYRKPAEWMELYREFTGYADQTKPMLTLGHQPFLGSRAPVGFKKEFVLSHGADIDPVNRPDRVVLLGDIHKAQTINRLGNVHYMGGFLQRNLNDMGRPSTILVCWLTTDNNWEVRWVTNPVSPLFARYAVSSVEDYLLLEKTVREINLEQEMNRRYLSVSVPKELRPQLDNFCREIQTWEDFPVILRPSTAGKVVSARGEEIVLPDKTDSVDDVVNSLTQDKQVRAKLLRVIGGSSL